MRAAYVAVVAVSGGLLLATSALGAELDPALARLVVAQECHAQPGPDGRLTEHVGRIVDDEATRQSIADKYTALGLPRSEGLCIADDVAFKKLVSEWGFALAPNGTYAARTTGYGGFNVGLQASYTTIDHNASFWRLGTEGARGADGASPSGGRPPALVSQYSLNIRKNFGLGFEALANVGFVPASSIINGGLDLRLSLLEGFRTGVGGVLPDLSIGGGVRTITGTPQLQLTTVAVDARISKPIVIASSSVLTPIVGYQYVWVFGRSGVIDLTPATDPLEYCGFAGTAIPRGDGSSAAPDGQVVCSGGTILDFNNDQVFEEANLKRQRLLFGLNYRYENLTTGVNLVTDLFDPADVQTNERDKRALSTCNGDDCSSMGRQWQLNVEAGFAF